MQMTNLTTLGLDPNKIYLIIHADDAGLCSAENEATKMALQNGSINSFSIMPPCPGFKEMLSFAKTNPYLDCGIHLTLTCEWKDFKWGPVLGKDKVPSLVDASGHFYKKREMFLTHAKPEEVLLELEAQIQLVLDAGVNPSHLDSHMYTLGLSEELLNIYRFLGKKYQLPVLLDSALLKLKNIDLDILNDKEDIIMDEVYLGTFEEFQKGALATFYENTLLNLTPGLNIILLHPAFNNAEMQAITIDHPNFGAAWRQIDYDFFTSSKCASIIANKSIEMITWQEIKQIIYN